MRITGIENQKKHRSRKNIYGDGEFLIGISNETLIRHGLRVGDEIDPGALRAIAQSEEVQSAKQIALRFLSHRPRTVREVRDKLREKEFGDEEIGSAILDLQHAGLLDDGEFARMLVRDALAAKPTGRLLLRRKLLLLGIEKGLVERTLAEAFQEVDQESAALAAAEKYIHKLTRMHPESARIKLRNRVSNFLSRRGFSWDVISPVLKKILSETHVESIE
jgi:regulatory protein